MGRQVLNRLKYVMLEKEYTNRRLAEELQKAESTVSLWVNNRKQPSLETFYKISMILDVDLRELFVSTRKTN